MPAKGGVLQGVIKSWNSKKGFGFIECQNVEGDVMFSHAELPQDTKQVHGKVLEGRQVQFEMTMQEDGRAKATEVLLLAGENDTLTGSIKSYSEKNGYGFITSSSLIEDCRFHRRDLPLGAWPSPGQKVTFKPSSLPDGKLRVSDLKMQDFGKGGSKGAVMMYGGYMDTGYSQLRGLVKSYSEKNGYGFINSPGQPMDIKFGKQDIAPWCQGQIQAGVSVNFETMPGPSGIQARNVEVGNGMKRSAGAMMPFAKGAKGYGKGNGYNDFGYGKGNGYGKDMGPPFKKQRVETATGKYLSGTIKSFNNKNGFGFITNQTGDFFFLRTSLPEESQSNPEALIGHSAQFELVKTQDGKKRAQNIQDITPA